METTDPEEQFTESRTCLEQLSKMHQALEVLRISCQDRLGGLRERLSGSVNKAGLLRLPNEILQKILVEADEEVIVQGKKTFAVSVSQVCRFLREVAHNTPQLWTRLSNLLHEDELAHRIEQSKWCGLDVQIRALTFGHARLSMKDFSQILREHEGRWRSFSYKVRDFDGGDGRLLRVFADEMRRHMSDLSLPELENLQISDKIGRTLLDLDEEDEDEDDEGSLDFYETWEMPKLLRVEFAFNLPMHSYSAQLWANLKSASIWVSGTNEDGVRLTSFLSQRLPELCELSIRIGDPGLPRGGCIGFIPNASCMFLPQVKVLQLVSTDPRSILAVKGLLVTPHVESLSLDIQYDPTNGFSRTSLANVFQLCRSPKIKDLEIKLRTYSPFQFDLFDNIFSIYKGLHRLSIEAPDSQLGTYEPKESWTGCLPLLKSLRLQDCTKISPTFVTDLIEMLGGKDGGGPFETLEVVQSTGLSKEFLERSTFRNKAVWYGKSSKSQLNDESDLEDDSSYSGYSDCIAYSLSSGSELSLLQT